MIGDMKVYYKNDFSVVVKLQDAEGGRVPVPQWKFSILFTDGRKVYECSYRKKNIEVVDGDIVCYLDRHGFLPGKISYTFVEEYPHSGYPDGYKHIELKTETAIELTKYSTDDELVAETTLIPGYVIYDAYMIAKQKGYEGTQSEFYEALNILPYATSEAIAIARDLQQKRDADYWRGAKGDTGEKGEKGDTGAQGEKGEKGERGANGSDGVDGIDGEDGFSPIVETSKVGKVTTVTINDANGTHTATINDGEDGKGSEIDAYTKAESDAKYANKDEVDKEVYIGEDTPPTETKIAINPNEIIELADEPGDSENKVLHQKAVTDNFVQRNYATEHFANKSEINTEVYVGTGTPQSEAKIVIDPAEDLVEIVQTTGSATDKVMSQKAVSDIIGNVEQLLANI